MYYYKKRLKKKKSIINYFEVIKRNEVLSSLSVILHYYLKAFLRFNI